MHRPLKILHIIRAPVGGAFRHVQDLAKEQARLGHAVGMLADEGTGNALTEHQLQATAPHFELGIHRIRMSRLPSFNDVMTIRYTRDLVQRLGIDVLHGHGAKGGLFARLGSGTATIQDHPLMKNGAGRLNGAGARVKGQAQSSQTDGSHKTAEQQICHAKQDAVGEDHRRSVLRFYTPHGGSLHFANRAILGPIYLGMESILQRFTDGIIFESAYAHKVYSEHVGQEYSKVRVVPNGLKQTDFVEIQLNDDAAEFVFIGELRWLKGIDVLIKALAQLHGTPGARLAIVGDGPDKQEFQSMVDDLGLNERVRFCGALTAQDAFQLGHIVVMPSRAESFPYVVLEAAAAGKPLIATNVGGIPEIVWGTRMKLVPSDNVDALAAAMQHAIDNPQALHDLAHELRQNVAQKFTVEGMADSVLEFYSDILSSKSEHKD